METVRKRDAIVSLSLLIIALGASVYAWIFGLVPEVRGLFGSKPDWLLQTAWYVPVFLVHLFLGGIAILAGAPQFYTHRTDKLLRLHRVLGKIYFFTTMPSGAAGFVLGFYATGSLLSKLGFICLAVGWLSCTIVGYLYIRNHNIVQHRQWMLRSYAFCLAFVTFRIYLGLGAVLGLEFYDYYSYISFLSWIPNILLAEYIIKRQIRAGMIKGVE